MLIESSGSAIEADSGDERNDEAVGPQCLGPASFAELWKWPEDYAHQALCGRGVSLEDVQTEKVKLDTVSNLRLTTSYSGMGNAELAASKVAAAVADLLKVNVNLKA